MSRRDGCQLAVSNSAQTVARDLTSLDNLRPEGIQTIVVQSDVGVSAVLHQGPANRLIAFETHPSWAWVHADADNLVPLQFLKLCERRTRKFKTEHN